MKRFLSIGECMLELSGVTSGTGEDLWRMGIAGDTLNTAWYARACLPEDWAVAYGTCIGTDEFSGRVPAFLTANGLEADRIGVHPKRSVGLYAIMLKEGERSFAYWRDSSAARTLADDADALWAMSEGADVIHVSGITLAILPPEGRTRLIEMLARRREAGALTVLDPNIRPKLWEDMATAADVLSRAATAASIIVPSFDDEQACFGDATPEVTLNRYLAAGADTVVVKNGGAEILAAQKGLTETFTDLPRVQPLDTTGAGDSFNGGFLASLATGHSLAQAVMAGHRVASQVVTHRGALVPMEELSVHRQG